VGRPKQFDPDVAVEQAMQVFWRNGYAATTPQDLVDALGIGKGSLYNAFGSKHDLFERALQRYREDQADALARVLDQPGPVKPRLRAALQFIVDSNFAGRHRRGCLAVNTAAELAGSDQQAAGQVRRMFDRTEAAFRAAIEEGQRSGEISADLDARAAGSLLLNTVVGMQLLAKAAAAPDRLTRVADTVLGLL
jgi:TetR/AcrR family transcriptional regulator, transcriptional repressor for nem operon